MISVGTLCLKIAGRDAGKRCVVLSNPENNRVLVGGETRRKLVSLQHIEPLASEAVAVKENANESDVAKLCQDLGWIARTSKAKKAGEKPKRTKVIKAKEKKKGEKKAEKKDRHKSDHTKKRTLKSKKRNSSKKKSAQKEAKSEQAKEAKK